MTPAMYIALSLSALFALVGVAMWLYQGGKRMVEAETRKLDRLCRPTPFLSQSERERYLCESYARRRETGVITRPAEYLERMRKFNAQTRDPETRAIGRLYVLSLRELGERAQKAKEN